MTAPHRYQFRNHLDHLGPLQETLDLITRTDLVDLDITAGQLALDVGAGAGSIARHLRDLVGPTGTVTAVDIDTRWLDPGGALEVHQRDLRTQPLPVEPDRWTWSRLAACWNTFPTATPCSTR